MPIRASHPCPKCNRLLPPAGEIVVTHEDGSQEKLITYSCDECLVTRELFGEPTEMALGFALDADGQPFDPADPDQPLTS